jgi:hypothetical protein
LADEEKRELLIVVDGLDKVKHERGEFIKDFYAFVDHLQQRILMVKILLTSRPQANIKEVFNRLLYIEYDKVWLHP